MRSRFSVVPARFSDRSVFAHLRVDLRVGDSRRGGAHQSCGGEDEGGRRGMSEGLREEGQEEEGDGGAHHCLDDLGSERSNCVR